ncbi:MAG TPA: PAS domain-containing protein [Gaiellaceae bacterium]|nr:PAS domain-containing protein [Gaiellaceae bacterium]
MTRLLTADAWREGRLWKGYSLVALALTVVYFLLGGHTDTQLVIYQMFILAAPIAIVAGVLRHRPDHKLLWLLFASGLGLWCIGDAYWGYYRWFLGEQAPYPSFADVAYLGGYFPLIAGGFLLVRGWGRPRLGDMLDLAIVSLAAGIVSAIFLLKPLVSTSDPMFAKWIAVGFPVADFVILVVLAQLMFRRRMMNFALRATIVATGALVVSDAVYSYLALTGSYTTGMIIDAGWLACYSLWPIAALHPSMARIRSLPRNETVGLSVWRIGALLSAMLAAPALLIVQTALHRHVETGEIGVIIVATTLLVAARVWILQRDTKKAQTALARMDERLRVAQGVEGISTWEMDLVTGHVSVSEQLAAMISGPSETEVTGENWAKFVHPDDIERVTETFEHARKHGGHFAYEYRFRSPNGEEGSLFSRGKVFLGENGTHPRAVGIAVDITDREAMEKRLERSEERLQLAQKLGGVGTWDTDLVTGEITWSESLREISGVDDDVQPTNETFAQLVHPDDRPGLTQAMARSIEDGQDFEYEYRLRRPNDGEQRWILTRGRRMTDAKGNAVRFLGIALDITERHAMDEQLKRSAEGMRMAQELGGVGSWDADLVTGKTTWSKNLRRISGVTDDVDATRESFIALVHPDDRAGFEAAMVAAVDRGGHLELEFRLVRPSDGELRWMLTRGDAVIGPNGNSSRFLGVVVDITEGHLAQEHRAKLERQLRQAHKLEAVGRLAGGVAHDFNNILLAIRGNGELALDALKDGENATEEVEEMVAAADRAAALTAQLLAYSRRQVLQAEVLDLNEIVRDMDKLLRRMIGEDVELHAVVADEAVLINADRSQIEQVIANLAVNAREAMPEGGVLTVEVAMAEIGSEHAIDLPPGPYARLTVNDTGAGMDPETVAKVFEPFFTTKEEGTGFGLSTVHGIVVQSGGSVWVYSEVDHGTTFKIFLPLTEQAQPLESTLPDKPAVIARSEGETILLVEDDPHVQRIVRNILSRSGYRVLAAGGGGEAIRLAGNGGGTIHLLLSDLVMPGTSGRELAVQIQGLRPDIAILYMSGYTDDAVIRRGVLEAGMAFIQKPFGADDLVRRVREVLDSDRDRMVAA